MEHNHNGHASPLILSARDVEVRFNLRGRTLTAVRGASLDLYEGETLAIVGESGCGKSVFTKSFIGMLDKNGAVTGGKILYRGEDLTAYKTEAEWLRVRGKKIAMVFQDPMTSLNPVFTIGNQLEEAILLHTNKNKAQAKERAIEMLTLVGVNEPAKRVKQYPYELSGGMRQRVMIAMALACEPDILIADEPTTALDVTIQAQILELMKELQQKLGMAIIMVTHDLGVIATMCDEIMVMYGGRVCERGTADDIFYNPRHEYTKGLLRSIPSTERMKERLVPIAGNPINLLNMPAGCAFCARCDRALKVCLDYVPMERQVGEDHRAACWLNDLALKDEAEKMIAAGQSAEAVQAATGWVKDENGQWVFDPVINEQEGGSGNEQ